MPSKPIREAGSLFKLKMMIKAEKKVCLPSKYMDDETKEEIRVLKRAVSNLANQYIHSRSTEESERIKKEITETQRQITELENK